MDEERDINNQRKHSYAVILSLILSGLAPCDEIRPMGNDFEQVLSSSMYPEVNINYAHEARKSVPF